MPTYKNIAAAWKKRDKNGKVYVSFKAEQDIKAGTSISLFANDKGGNQARPDFRAYEKIEDEQQPSQQSEGGAGNVEDDIPF